MTDQEKYAQMQEAMDNFINKVAQRAKEEDLQSSTLKSSQDKTAQMQEAMDNFITRIEERARESDLQSSTVGSIQDNVTQTANKWGSDPSQINNFKSDKELEDYFDNDEFDSSSDDYTDPKSEYNTTQSSNLDYNRGSNSELYQSGRSRRDGSSISLDKGEWKRAWSEAMQSMKTMYDNERIQNERKKPDQPKQCDDIIFKKNTLMCNGQPFEYKVLQREVDWGIKFTKSFSMDSKINNLDKLNEKIIDDLVTIFGDLSRITEIAVISGLLIVNGVHYYPLCNNQDFLNGLPFDCLDYFKEGLIGEFFDYGYLTYMPCLMTLKIDSMDFALRKVAPDLNLAGKFTVNGVFKKVPSLRYLEIGDEGFTYPAKSKKSKSGDKGESFEERAERFSRLDNVYNGFLVGNISTFRNWNFNNLKTYACNRGEKGFFKYSGGVLFRGAGTAVVGVGELGLRMVGGIVRGSYSLLKKAFSDE